MQTSQGTVQFPDVIQFQCTNEPLELDISSSIVLNFSTLTNLDPVLLNSTTVWHMITVFHEGRVSKREILKELFNVTKNEFFAPILYHQRPGMDFFFVNNQASALTKIIDAGMVLKVNGGNLNLNFNLGIGKWKPKHPRIINKIHAAVESRIQTMDKTNFILDFSSFSNSALLQEFEVSLQNKPTLQILCDQVNNQTRLKKRELSILFKSNDINTLEPFTKLYGLNIKKIDLKDNDIENIEHFHYIKHLNIETLEVDENPKILKALTSTERIFKILPTIKFIDIKMDKTLNAPSGPSSLPHFPKPIDLGKGNNIISKFVNGTSISFDYRKRENFFHLRDNLQSFTNDKKWTQVIIFDSSASKDSIFKALLEQIFTDCIFFPCYYQKYAKHHEFFLNKQMEAIKCLMQHNLEFFVGEAKIKTKITLKLNVATFEPMQVDYFYKIQWALQERIKNKSLNFDNFGNDPKFSHLAVLTSSAKNVSFILDVIAKKQCSDMQSLSVKSNEFVNLLGFSGLPFYFPGLQDLDFRDNKIQYLDGLTFGSHVKNVQLAGNPICENFSSPSDYCAAVLTYFDGLETLDGVKIDNVVKLPTLTNYISSNHAYNLVDEFIKTFFNLYDFERSRLKDLYRVDSIFTITAYYDTENVSGKLATIYSRIQTYRNVSRFLLKLSNMSHASQNVFVGPTAIVDIFDRLPRSQHDMETFSVDVSHHSDEFTVLRVTGSFEDFGRGLNEKSRLFLGFSRNFILKIEDNEVYISNDQIHIFNLKSDTPNDTSGSITEYKHIIDKDEDEQVKLILFKEITNLKQDEALRLLDESGFDFKVALGVFKTLMDNNNFHDSAFDFEI